MKTKFLSYVVNIDGFLLVLDSRKVVWIYFNWCTFIFLMFFMWQTYSFIVQCSKEQLETKLLYAINADAGFDLS